MLVKTTLITGGASGIGEACARRFHAEGDRVAVLDVNAERGQAIADELGELAHFYSCDVADAGSVDDAVGRVRDAWGRIDAAVCSAGILEKPSTIMDMDQAVHDRLWQVNYNGTVNTCRAVGRAMGDNPAPIYIPCHRVVPASGGIGGWSGPGGWKTALLKLEGLEM